MIFDDYGYTQFPGAKKRWMSVCGSSAVRFLFPCHRAGVLIKDLYENKDSVSI